MLRGGTRFWRRSIAAVGGLVLAASLLVACGDSSDDNSVTLVTHESFKVSREVLKEFEKSSGLDVKILRSGDAGSAVNQAILTKGKPQGDVLFGVDNTYLSRALKEDIFTPYATPDLTTIPAEFRLDAKNRVTPVDYGDVCVNYDKAYYATRNLTPPQTLAELAEPQYAGQLVVMNPATSSPGLAFLLATVAEFGADGWPEYWEKLKANGVEVVDGWEQAYYERYSVGKGDRPLVVSYGSSPPVEVAFADDPPAEAPSGVASETCFRQIEFAGLLDGAKNASGGRKLIDFLVSERFQRDMPMQMFVYPVRPNTPLPDVFTKHAVTISAPKTVEAQQITENREQWITEWRNVVLG